MNNTNQQLYTIYNNAQRFYDYRGLVNIDEPLDQDKFIKTIQKDKYIILSSVNRSDVVNEAGEIDSGKMNSIKEKINSHNEKSKSQVFTMTNILLVYPGTECESKRANMIKLINHIRYPNSNVIIITPTKITSGVSKGLQSLSSHKEHKGHTFKAFTYTLLNSIIPEYDLAPKYEILTSDQIKELSNWFVEIDSLPKIFEHDPQMVWIGASVGDIIKYTFLSEVTIEGVGYCKVIPSV